MSDRTNVYRAERAFKALKAYKAEEKDTGSEIGEDIVDLVVDLHHLLQHHSVVAGAGLDTEEVVEAMGHVLVVAHSHYEAEA